MKARKNSFEDLVLLKCEEGVPVSTKRSKISVEQYTDEFGRVLERPCIATVDVAEDLSKFKVSDFCIDNLAAAGSLGSLVTQVIHGSDMNIADNIEFGLHILDGIEVEE